MNTQPELKIDLSIKDRIIKTYHFSKFEVVVGRDPSADIIIDNTGISRFHMKIEMNAGGTYIVKDMGSTNGIFLNGQLVKEEPLRNNDLITLGKFDLRVSIEKEESTPRRVQPKSGDTSVDIDGTTVLSKEQMAKMMANVQKETAKKPAAFADADSSSSKGLPVGLLVAGGVILVIILIAGAFFIF